MASGFNADWDLSDNAVYYNSEDIVVFPTVNSDDAGKLNKEDNERDIVVRVTDNNYTYPSIYNNILVPAEQMFHLTSDGSIISASRGTANIHGYGIRTIDTIAIGTPDDQSKMYYVGLCLQYDQNDNLQGNIREGSVEIYAGVYLQFFDTLPSDLTNILILGITSYVNGAWIVNDNPDKTYRFDASEISAQTEGYKSTVVDAHPNGTGFDIYAPTIPPTTNRLPYHDYDQDTKSVTYPTNVAEVIEELPENFVSNKGSNMFGALTSTITNIPDQRSDSTKNNFKPKTIISPRTLDTISNRSTSDDANKSGTIGVVVPTDYTNLTNIATSRSASLQLTNNSDNTLTGGLIVRPIKNNNTTTITYGVTDDDKGITFKNTLATNKLSFTTNSLIYTSTSHGSLSLTTSGLNYTSANDDRFSITNNKLLFSGRDDVSFLVENNHSRLELSSAYDTNGIVEVYNSDSVTGNASGNTQLRVGSSLLLSSTNNSRQVQNEYTSDIYNEFYNDARSTSSLSKKYTEPTTVRNDVSALSLGSSNNKNHNIYGAKNNSYDYLYSSSRFYSPNINELETNTSIKGFINNIIDTTTGAITTVTSTQIKELLNNQISNNSSNGSRDTNEFTITYGGLTALVNNHTSGKTGVGNFYIRPGDGIIVFYYDNNSDYITTTRIFKASVSSDGNITWSSNDSNIINRLKISDILDIFNKNDNHGYFSGSREISISSGIEYSKSITLATESDFNKYIIPIVSNNDISDEYSIPNSGGGKIKLTVDCTTNGTTDEPNKNGRISSIRVENDTEYKLSMTGKIRTITNFWSNEGESTNIGLISTQSRTGILSDNSVSNVVGIETTVTDNTLIQSIHSDSGGNVSTSTIIAQLDYKNISSGTSEVWFSSDDVYEIVLTDADGILNYSNGQKVTLHTKSSTSLILEYSFYK